MREELYIFMRPNERKIYIHNLNKVYQPKRSDINYPIYAKDYGVEQDFIKYLLDNELTTKNPKGTDLHYLPVFWTRYWINNNFGKFDSFDLRNYLTHYEDDQNNLFTICQYDDGPLTNLNFGKGLFLSSRKTESGSDAPLLATKLPFTLTPEKKYLATFIGRIETHEIRKDIAKVFSNKKRYYVSQETHSPREYKRIIKSGLACLAPRGYGGNSFRFYEAMQLGVCPILIGDLDTRPFKNAIPWDKFSFFVRNSEEALEVLEKKSISELEKMGMQAQKIYESNLKFGKWPRLLIDELA